MNNNKKITKRKENGHLEIAKANRAKWLGGKKLSNKP